MTVKYLPLLLRPGVNVEVGATMVLQDAQAVSLPDNLNENSIFALSLIQ